MESKNLKFGLEEHTIDKIVGVFQQYTEIERVVLYGSRAKGNYRPGSDIDLSLVGQQLSHEQLLSIEHQLDDLLLPYLFDLSVFSHIEDPEVIDHINRIGLTFYRRPDPDIESDLMPSAKLSNRP